MDAKLKLAAKISSSVMALCFFAYSQLASDPKGNAQYIEIAATLTSLSFVILASAIITLGIRNSNQSDKVSFGHKLITVLLKSLLYVVLPAAILSLALVFLFVKR